MRSIFYCFVFLITVVNFYGCAHNGSPAGTAAQAEDSISRMPDNDAKITALNRAIYRFSNDPKLYKMRAQTHDKLFQLESAVKDAEMVIKLDSLNAANYFYIADLCMKKPYMTGAIGAMHHLIKVLPGEKRGYEKLGEYYFIVKEYENSIKYLNSALRLDPNMPEALFYKGCDYKDMGNNKMAVLHFQRAIEVDPKYIAPYLQLGVIGADNNDPKAESYFSSALQLDPDNKGALYGRGMYYQKHDSLNLALKDYLHILQNDSSSELVNYNVAYCYYLQKDYSKALRYFNRTLQINQLYEQAYYGRGLTYKALHKNKEAEADLKYADDLKAKKPVGKNP